MFNLILKDILIQKRTFLISILALLLFAIIDNSVMMTYFITVTYVWLMTACGTDDKNKADYMLNSLPIKRDTIVLARYLSILTFTGIGFILYLLVSKIVFLLGISLPLNPLSFFDFFQAFGIIVFLSCLYLPFYYKFGYAKSRIVQLILLVGLFTILPILVKKLSLPPENSLVKFIAHLVYGGFDIKSIIYILITLFVIFITSLTLSINFYRRREF